LTVLQDILIENYLINKPQIISNVEKIISNVKKETGVVTTDKRIKTVRYVTSAEKGECVTIVDFRHTGGQWSPCRVCKRIEIGASASLLDAKFIRIH
jgi:hypothetical protein